MAEPNPLFHRFHLAEIERLARRPGPLWPRTAWPRLRLRLAFALKGRTARLGR